MALEQTVGQLADHVGGTVVGDRNIKITGAATLSEAGHDDVSFLANPKYEKEVDSTSAAAVVVGTDFQQPNKTVIQCSDPYYSFMQIVVLLHGHREHESIGISSRASVAESAQIGSNVDIHDFVCVSAQAQIGDNTSIYPNCTIGPGSKIGSDCIIYPNVTIYDGCTIGNRVIIHAGTVIGQDGFGYATHDGVHHKIPAVGGVIIEDDVEIGANCSIDRATLGDTIIGHGTKFSNQVVIGHNSQIGPHCLLGGMVGVSGSVRIGKHCGFAGQAGVVGHLKIGNYVRVGPQSGVQNNIPDGQTVLGSPALPITQAKRSLIALKDLPELRRRVRELERIVDRLEEQLE